MGSFLGGFDTTLNSGLKDFFPSSWGKTLSHPFRAAFSLGILTISPVGVYRRDLILDP
jgi:hypothetical protein